MVANTGMPVWYELMSPDPGTAKAFYADVLRWRFDDRPAGPDQNYWTATAGDDDRIAGVLRPQGAWNGPAAWYAYHAVDDVDAAADRVTALGGAVHIPGTEVPGVGRFAFVADPQGAFFYLMQGDGNATSQAFQSGPSARPGHAVWNELTARDPDAALSFYRELLGWRQDGAMPMGELGDYRFLFSGDVCIGAMMGEVPNGRFGWQFYFLVEDIDAATDRLRAAGGTVLQGPDQIPGGAFSVVASDPNVARFGIVGPRNAKETT